MSDTVFIATPALERPTWGFVDSLLFLDAPAGYIHRRVMGVATALARNMLVEQFLETDCQHMLFLDSDAWITRGTLLRLLSWEQPVVGALCFSVSRPAMPTVFRGWTDIDSCECRVGVHEVRAWIVARREMWTNGPMVLSPRPDDALLKVDATGAHCLLVHRSVFETVEPPWFESHAEKPRVGEDFYFCRKLGAADIPVCVDLSVVAGHMAGRVSVGCMDFLAWYAVVDWDKSDIDEKVILGGKHGSS
jgi:hypothetical protein